MNAKQISQKAKDLYRLVPEDGTFAGNTSLLRESGLGPEYWDVRKELVDAGLIILGKGRGGSIARNLSVATVLEPPKAGPSGSLVANEADLYKPLKECLDQTWGRDADTRLRLIKEGPTTLTSQPKFQPQTTAFRTRGSCQKSRGLA